ncbi:hypothetical protein [Neorhizobium galegae]|uniref:hypothetical protein n=1 Tax=Neorhizobium galegae TaxID=399 RepID=UPI00351D50DE
MNNRKIRIAMLASHSPATMAVAGPTLDKVKARGHVVCGASQGTVGLGAPDDKGYWRGFDVAVA